MTLTEALRALVKAGRIRSPWLTGMMVGVELPDRLICGLRITGRGRGRDDGLLYCAHTPVPLGAVAVPADGVVDVSVQDPATVGCLLALLREATGDPMACVMSSTVAAAWVVKARGVYMESYTTEGEAIAAALVALAEAL